MLKSRSKSPTKIVFFTISLLFLHIQIKSCNCVSPLTLDSLKSPEIDAMLKSVCAKSVRNCVEDEEMEMDSEINRRVLMMQKKYISYDTLKKDLVPCERPGASYYNCGAAGAANPYTRGCEVITGCARDVRDIKS